MTGLLLAGVVLALLALRQNVLVILAAALVGAYLLWGEDPLSTIALDMWDGLNKDVLLSIPLFILAGALMARGSMARRLVALMRAASDWMPGGLAVAAVLSCALFAAVSGSGTVTLLAVGAVMYPALLAAGYPRAFSIGLLCAAGTLGIVIPPSIPMILYGVMTQTSIADLFVAGIGPGLLLTLLLGGYGVLRNRALVRGRFEPSTLLRRAREAGWALAMPAIVLGGIYSGQFTATESAAVALAYALLVERYVHRELDWRGVADVATEAARTLGALFPVLMLAFALNVFLALERVPETLTGLVAGRIEEPAALLLAMNLLLLVVGCVVDIGSAILLLAPLLEPLAAARGVDPVHLGVIMVVNLEIGYLTPPMGLNLIVAAAAFREDFWMVCRAVLPFIALMLLALAVVTYWPPLTQFLL